MSPPTRLLGIDTGSVRIGLAISDADRLIASPLATYVRRNLEQDGSYFRNLMKEENIGELVVGLPVHNDGREGVKAREARAFGDWLGRLTALPVHYVDERFSTVQAESMLWEAQLTHKKRKARRDQVAATIILQTYLEQIREH